MPCTLQGTAQPSASSGDIRRSNQSDRRNADDDEAAAGEGESSSSSSDDSDDDQEEEEEEDEGKERARVENTYSSSSSTDEDFLRVCGERDAAEEQRKAADFRVKALRESLITMEQRVVEVHV